MSDPNRRPRARTLVVALATLALVAVSAPGCQRIKDALGIGADEAAEGSGAAAISPNGVVSPAESPVAQALTAELPADALALIPGDADLYVALDLGTLRRLVQRVVPSLTDEVLRGSLRELMDSSDIPEDVAGRLDPLAIEGIATGAWFDSPGGVLVVDRAAIADLPAEGEPAQALGGGLPLMVASVGDYAVVGFGPPFIAATGDSDTGAPRDAWPAGWAAVPDGAMFAMVAPDLSSLPAEMRDGMPEGLDATALAWGFRLDGAFGAAIATPDDRMIRAALGSLQAEMMSGIAELTSEVPPDVGNVRAYLELVTRAIWSQVELTREDGVTRLTIGSASCGTVNLSSVALVGAIASMFEARAFDPNATWHGWDQPVAEGCATIPGPPPAIPRGLSRLAPNDTSTGQFLALFDLGALLRHQLPNAFGVLPFALRPEDVTEALGARPFGLNGLDDPNATFGSFIFSGNGEQQVIAVMPAGVRALLPDAPPDLEQRPAGEFGVAVGAPEFLGRLDAQPPTAGPWADMVDGLAPDTVGVVIMTTETNEMSDVGGPMGDAFNAILSRARLAAIAVDADLEVSFYFTYDGDAVSALRAARDAAENSLRDAVRELPEDQRSMAASTLRSVFSAIVIESAGENTGRVRMQAPGMSSGAFTPFLAVAALAYYGAAQPVSEPLYVEMPGSGQPDLTPLVEGARAFYATERFDATGKALPQRFPANAGPTPTFQELQMNCGYGGPGVVPNAAVWASGGWAELGVTGQPFSYSPMPFALGFESSGVGPDATFTATAWRDIDCNGIYATWQQTGSVVGGQVVVSPVTMTNPTE